MKKTIRIGLFEFSTSGENVSIGLPNIKKEELNEKKKVSPDKHKNIKNQKNTQKK